MLVHYENIGNSMTDVESPVFVRHVSLQTRYTVKVIVHNIV